MDLILKDIPEGAVQAVKDLAMVAVERYLRARDVKVTEEVQSKFETDCDTIREANDLTPKYKAVDDDELGEVV